MSEALYVFTMLATTRYLLRWLRNDDLPSLVYAGVALGIAYLDRSEPVAAAMVTAPLVLVVTYLRGSGARRVRFWSGMTDATVFVAPIITSFAAWAVMSYIITGQAFQQFSSTYGNSSQVAAAKATGQIPAGSMAIRLLHEAKATGYLAPAFPIIVVVAVLIAIYRRNSQLWVIATVLGGGWGFTMLTYLANSIFPWFRFYILVIPIEVLLVGSMFATPFSLRSRALEVRQKAMGTTGSHRDKKGKLLTIASAILASVISVCLLAPSIPGTVKGMDNPKIGPEYVGDFGYLFHTHLNKNDVQMKHAYATIEYTASYIDSLHLTNGSIVVDTGADCVPELVTRVTNPRVFVITNDRDFQRTLADPLTFHAHYLMYTGTTKFYRDAVGEQYPNLSTASWAKFVRVLPGQGYCVPFHLYRVIGHPSTP